MQPLIPESLRVTVRLPSDRQLSAYPTGSPHAAPCQGGYCDSASLNRFLTGLVVGVGGGVAERVFLLDDDVFP